MPPPARAYNDPGVKRVISRNDMEPTAERRLAPLPARVIAGVIVLALAPASAIPALARSQKTVFHGLPVEADSALKPGQSKQPIDLTPAWTFTGLEAPLAGDPVAVKDRLIAVDRDGNVVALSAADGAEAWRTPLGEPPAAGPAVLDGVVFQGTTSGGLRALALEDGKEIWRAPLEGVPTSPPLLAAGRIVVATDAPSLVALQAGTGAVLARLPLPGLPVAPTLEGEDLLIGTEHGMVLDVDPATFTVRWRRYMRHAVTAPPFADGKRVYVAVADRSLRCLKLSSGSVLWSQKTGSTVTARLLEVDDFVYVPCFDNYIYVLHRRSGHLRGRIRLDHRLSQDVAILGGHLFVTPFTEGSVVGLELPDLKVAGRYHLDAPGEWFTARPVVSGNRVAVSWGRDAGRITALDIAPGKAPAKTGAIGLPVRNEAGPSR
jgi:outer membrane protein assembly factor BamB